MFQISIAYILVHFIHRNNTRSKIAAVCTWTDGSIVAHQKKHE